MRKMYLVKKKMCIRDSFNPFTCDAQCPCCQESEYTVLSGKEFLIKEILAC